MEHAELEQIEVTLLLEAIYQRYSYDFRSYTRGSIERRLRQLLSAQRIDRISQLIPRLLYDEAFFSELIQHFSIPVSEMFRDPFVFRALREQVLPLLRTYPFFKVWHAGCATGEEVYSLAILLREEGLLERATIFGTDFNDSTLEQARQGIYPATKLQTYTKRYQEAGGQRSLSEYYHCDYDLAVLDRTLQKQLTFANHNLASDAVFGEMHLILCRNVLIYFNKTLRARVLSLLSESLVRGGFLCLGTKEDLDLSAAADQFEVVDARARIYKKRQ